MNNCGLDTKITALEEFKLKYRFFDIDSLDVRVVARLSIWYMHERDPLKSKLYGFLLNKVDEYDRDVKKLLDTLLMEDK